MCPTPEPASIEASPQANLTLEYPADGVGVSTYYAGKLFQEQTGVSGNGHINELPMGKAAAMLTSGDASVSQISQSVGKMNTNCFYTLFKKA